MKKLVVICVDDEKIVLDSLKDELKDSLGDDYIYETAEGGIDALDVMDELTQTGFEIAVFISDYIMPHMKGDELLKRVHGISPDTIKIMLTGQATIEAVGNAVNYAKLYRFITKPWDHRDLILTVSEGLRSYIQSKRLELQHQELVEMNNTLEQKVKERTKELSNALEKLKSIQMQLIQTSKMAAIGHLAAGVAHEINNPISAVQSAADLSNRLLEKMEYFTHAQDLNNTISLIQKNNYTILKGADRITQLVEHLNAFTALDQSNYKMTDIHTGIESALTLLQYKVEGTVKIVKKFDKVPAIGCYPGQLNQAFMAILRFLLKNLKDGGTILIESKLEKQSIVLLFINDGWEIPAERLERIFDFGFDNYDSRIRFEFDLFNVYNIIQQHKGTIKVSKQPQKTVFRLTLPIKGIKEKE
ncbi:response regulator [candidate division KSB1 bacterium]|nr:response regulator [candidate division KSB1 bacterium]